MLFLSQPECGSTNSWKDSLLLQDVLFLFFKYAVYYIQIYMISDTRKIGRNHCDVLQVSCIQNPASSVLRGKVLAKVCSSVVYVLYVGFLIMFTGLD